MSGQADGRRVRGHRFVQALLVVGMLSSVGCRGRNLIGGGGGDGGPPDGPAPSADAPDASVPIADAASDPVPEVVDPEVSRAWTWQPCGTLVSEASDTAAVIDPKGDIAVLGPRGVRLYDASGSLLPSSNGPADFLIAGPEGAPLAGTITSSAIVMTPIGAAAPLFTFALPAPSNCGNIVSLSASGDFVLALGSGAACVWRTSDQALVGNTGNIGTGSVQIGLRDDKLVSIEWTQTVDVVTRDLTGRETARARLADAGASYLSPSGHRLVMRGALWDLDNGTIIPWTPAPLDVSYIPTFSAAGDLVLFAGGVYRTSDGVRERAWDSGSRVSESSYKGTALSPDGRRIVAMQHGRATLMDITSAGIAAVLGPPVRPDPSSGRRPINQLALAADGSLLVSNHPAFAAFGIKLAPSFGASKVIWNIHAEINLDVDISRDNQLVAIGGDGRALFSAVDGRIVWPAAPPPADVIVSGSICLPEHLRFSPKRTWVAGNNYERMLEVFAVGDATSATQWKPVVQLPSGCDAVAFSRDERLMATSGAALYQTAPTGDGWRKLWSSDVPAPPPDTSGISGWANDVSFSPHETQLLVSGCNTDNVCTTSLLNAQTGTVLRSLSSDLQAAHPSFSPDGSWIVAGSTLLHLASGDVRPLDPTAKTTVALFTPEGDIIAASADFSLTRYCRSR